MAFYKVKTFDRFARSHRIADATLVVAARRVLIGDAEADLGSGLYKVRIARSGGGKSGGFRALATYRSNGHCFFVFGFEKSARANITPKESRALKLMAKTLGSLDGTRIGLAVRSGELVEVSDEGNQETIH